MGSNRPDFENKFVPEGSIQDIGDDFIAYITPKSNSNLAAQTTGTENGASVNLATKNEIRKIKNGILKSNQMVHIQ